jgi:hypothetical protein
MRPIAATAATLIQTIGAGIVLLWWFAWSFGFGVFPDSLIISSILFFLPIALTVAAAIGLHRGREWGWWLSVAMNAVALFCLLAASSFGPQAVLLASLFLSATAFLLLPTTRSYYFTYRP